MLSRIQSYCCATCGSPIGEAQPAIRILDCNLTRQQRQIIEMLTDPVGAWVNVRAIEKTLWQGNGTKRDVNPSAQLISTQICKMQPTLRDVGWFIKSDRRGHYRLIPLTAGAQ